MEVQLNTQPFKQADDRATRFREEGVVIAGDEERCTHV
jgi:hypothetical protein